MKTITLALKRLDKEKFPLRDRNPLLVTHALCTSDVDAVEQCKDIK